MSEALFDREEGTDLPADAEEASRIPRLRVPHRDQIEMHCASLDQLLEPEHPVRLVWQAVTALPLESWREEIKAVQGHVGRNATDPRLLLALWVFATLEGVGSARELARLCEQHVAYRWLCGGVTVNHHLLSDFRSQGDQNWDDLLTSIVGSLLAQGLVTMNRVAQDGMRVRAHAGSSSFRRRDRLGKFLDEARQQVETLKQLADESPEELGRRQRAARERAASARAKRVEEAIRQCEQLQSEREVAAKKRGQPAREARASTTDPEARVMKFSDGGYRPGYNVQFSTETQSQIIVGVDVTNVGNDQEQLVPMLDQLRKRYGRTPAEVLVDGGFTALKAIEQATQAGCLVYGSIKGEDKQLRTGTDPYAKKKRDSTAVAAWRARMATEAGKAISRLRGQTAEWVNAMARNRGLRQMPVRGQARCRTVALLYAIAHNLMQMFSLIPHAAP
jgi:transposase